MSNINHWREELKADVLVMLIGSWTSSKGKNRSPYAKPKLKS